MIEEDAEGTGDLDGSEEFRIQFEKADGYDLVPVSGAHGDVQPRGDIKVEFHTEQYTQPSAEIYELTDDGIGDLKDEVRDSDVQRIIQFGMQVDQGTSYRIGLLLLSLATNANQETIHQAVSNVIPDEDE